MAVWVRVAGSVRVLVFVLVEYDLQAPAERISDAAQRLQAWNMIAAFEARDHGFCHPKSLRQLLLSLACMSAKLEQAVSALGGDCDAVIRQALSPSGRAGCALAGSAKVSDARFRRLSIDRFWRRSGRSPSAVCQTLACRTYLYVTLDLVHQWRWVWLRNPELFPTSVRFSGVSIGKQLGIVLGGGIAPMIATALLARNHGDSSVIAIYYSVICAVTFLVLLATRETRNIDITEGGGSDRTRSATDETGMIDPVKQGLSPVVRY